MLGDEKALERWLRCPLPTHEETALRAKTTGLLVLGALELLRAGLPPDIRRLVQARLEEWCADLMGCMDGYLRDTPGQELVGLWGYHQLPALAAAGAWLGQPEYLAACAQTVERVIVPTIAARFLYAFPDVKEGQCAYCISPLVHGLAELYRATGEARYRELALRGCRWFSGNNDAGAVMYDPASGRCLDGISNGQASRNCGAESAIEAGLAELERRSLAGG